MPTDPPPTPEMRDNSKRHDAIEFVITMAYSLSGNSPEVAEHTLRCAIESLITLGVGPEEMELAIHDAAAIIKWGLWKAQEEEINGD